MKNLFACLIFFGLPSLLFSQKKQSLQFEDYQKWRHIENREISADGHFVSWTLAKNTEGDPILQLWSAEKNTTDSWPRGDGGKFSDDENWFFFKIKPPLDSIKKLRRKKVKDDDLPRDTLAIFNLKTRELTKIADLKNFAVPEKWSGWLVFLLEPGLKKEPQKDSTAIKNDSVLMKKTPGDSTHNLTKPASKISKKIPKKEGKENGNRLIIRQLQSGKQDTLPFVTEFVLAKNRPRLAAISTGRDSSLQPGAYFFDLEKSTSKPLLRGPGEFKNIALDDEGGQAREKWLRDGKPGNPGRLNDLRHIIYKSADHPWRRARRNLGLMMREGLLKENIDGEAILWAHHRLSGRPEQRRILMVISDGAPVDDSTLSANPGNYLERHLREVIGWVETRSDVELTAIGIGHDVTRYYSRAVTITDVEQLAGAMTEQLAALFDNDPVRLGRAGRARRR